MSFASHWRGLAAFAAAAMIVAAAGYVRHEARPTKARKVAVRKGPVRKEAKKPPRTFTLVAVGDIIPHQAVREAAARQADGYAGLWRQVNPVFARGDLVFGNLETPIAPTSGRLGRSMVFNASEDLARSLKASGVTLVSVANNHAFDQGQAGLRETLGRLAKHQIAATGAGTSREAAERTLFLQRGGLRVAVLAFADLLNVDLNKSPASPWVRRLDLEPAARAVAEARRRADVVLVSVHWGNEYETKPSARQRRAAKRLVDAGADVILGHHPHVLQAVERMQAPGGRSAVVAYSLGNFLSNMATDYGPWSPVARGDRRDGMALVVRVGARGPETVKYEPLWVENGAGKMQVVHVRKALRELQAQAGMGGRASPIFHATQGPAREYQKLLRRKKRIEEIVGKALR